MASSIARMKLSTGYQIDAVASAGTVTLAGWDGHASIDLVEMDEASFVIFAAAMQSAAVIVTRAAGYQSGDAEPARRLEGLR